MEIIDKEGNSWSPHPETDESIEDYLNRLADWYPDLAPFTLTD